MGDTGLYMRWCLPFKIITFYWINYYIISIFFLATPHGLWDPRPGIEPMPPAVEHRVLTTGPPGNSLLFYLNQFNENLWDALFCLVLPYLPCSLLYDGFHPQETIFTLKNLRYSNMWQGLANYQIWPAFCFWKKVILEHSQAHSFMYCSWHSWVAQQKPCGPQSQKYLLSGLL